MLALAAVGATMGELCEKLIAHDPVDQEDSAQAGGGAARAFQILARWVDDGLLTLAADTTSDGRKGDRT